MVSFFQRHRLCFITAVLSCLLSGPAIRLYISPLLMHDPRGSRLCGPVGIPFGCMHSQYKRTYCGILLLLVFCARQPVSIIHGTYVHLVFVPLLLPTAFVHTHLLDNQWVGGVHRSGPDLPLLFYTAGIFGAIVHKGTLGGAWRYLMPWLGFRPSLSPGHGGWLAWTACDQCVE